MPDILVINPNSNQAVTDNMSEAVEGLRFAGGPNIRCVTLDEGPVGIETQAHIDAVVDPIVQLIGKSTADAFVIGCYSDPGLVASREVVKKPVFGLQQAALTTALQQCQNLGVLAMSEMSISRHLAYIERLGFLPFLAAERPLNMSVDEGRQATNYNRVLEVGKKLVSDDKAQSVVLGCAGLACHRKALEADLGVPVIDPVQAATAQALVAVLNSNN